MRDFTLKTYQELISAFKGKEYQFLTFEEYMTSTTEGKVLILRHDVDEKAWNALKMAKVENELGVKATYFFRIVKQSNVPEVIKEIVNLGHEVGYHYEDLATAEGDINKALESFKQNLNYFRQFYPVKSICMHGSSTSKYDNRTIWNVHKLSDFGLTGEPYLSVDFNKVYYLTDIGRAWDGGRFAVRDVVTNDFGLKMHSSWDIIDTLDKGQFPSQAMILAHTLWTDSITQWYYLQMREYARNNIKLIAKKNKTVSKLYGTLVKHYWK